jgi:Tfp pilus assembly protein PilF
MNKVSKYTKCIIAISFLLSLSIGGGAGCAVPPEPPPPGAAATTKAKVDSLVKMGDANLREGKFRQALKHYLEAEKLDPKDAELKFRIALVFGNYYRKPQEAINYYNEAISLKPNYSEAYNNLGVIYLSQKRWDEAISMFNKALENLFYPTPEKAYLGLARAYRGKGQTDKAVENYQMAIEQAPEFAPLRVDLGLYLMELGRYKDALESLNRARALMEKNAPQRPRSSPEEIERYRALLASVFYQVGLCRVKLGRIEGARVAFEKALSLTDDDELRRKIQEELEALPSPSKGR